MTIRTILLPLFVQVALTFALWFWMAYYRVTLIRRGDVDPRNVALREPNWPPHVLQIANAAHNQLEMPILFYVLTILAIITRHADVLFVVLAWIFVILRLLHAYIHVTSNRADAARTGFRSFTVGPDDHVDHFRRAHPRRPGMTPAARLAAAIEVFADIDARRRPAADALKDWGLAHRFAGSGDRAAIAGLVYDALRRKASAAFVMVHRHPRAVLLGMLRLERDLDTAAIAQLAG